MNTPYVENHFRISFADFFYQTRPSQINCSENLINEHKERYIEI